MKLVKFNISYLCKISTPVYLLVTNTFVCPSCDRSFPTRHSMERHEMYRHTGKKPYRCRRCTYACVESSHLKRHVTTYAILTFNQPRIIIKRGAGKTTSLLSASFRYLASYPDLTKPSIVKRVSWFKSSLLLKRNIKHTL